MNLIKIQQIDRITFIVYSASADSYEYCGLDRSTYSIYKPPIVFSTADAAEKQGRSFIDLYLSLN